MTFEEANVHSDELPFRNEMETPMHRTPEIFVGFYGMPLVFWLLHINKGPFINILALMTSEKDQRIQKY